LDLSMFLQLSACTFIVRKSSFHSDVEEAVRSLKTQRQSAGPLTTLRSSLVYLSTHVLTRSSCHHCICTAWKLKLQTRCS
jgi:hypothetical protein